MADSQSACPHRKYMEDPGIVWREGKPDFSVVDKAYLAGRTRNHKEGSLEKIVEDLVKSWEMEASHKIRIEVTFFFLNSEIHSLNQPYSQVSGRKDERPLERGCHLPYSFTLPRACNPREHVVSSKVLCTAIPSFDRYSTFLCS